ncbi:hypothetical protein M406DRAFT_331197 [Cryphonectria parasitica EP155]|uniref:Uncharacterized protein n=1 Tax=Cryphonectria parasitica (strain ATCC 38755 / EP155) TaxID=660469 RepID=A0A9P4Y1N9_CRYP1|nr:uncharacterized protein M406DRAFT_331197 [Cryphonectria parasitica EP155]KAF3764879.1 hypothetical protein M406DRAFT_331197 [Cryphonectria parasitica EP155]
MATNASHTKKLSSGSASGFHFLSPETSRIPRPASRASATRSPRRPLELDECIRMAQEKFGVNYNPGSPSPAPRPTTRIAGTADRRTPTMPFTDKAIDMGRVGVKHTRRESTLSAKGALGALSRDDEESDEEFARKMQQFDEAEKKMRAMKEKKTWVKRNGASPAVRKASASSADDGIIGNSNSGSSKSQEPRQDWGKPDSSYSKVLQRFAGNPESAAAFNEKLGFEYVKDEQRLKRKAHEQDTGMAAPRAGTTTPPPNDGYSWQVDDDFTAEDLQVSTSPPVGYARTNTKIDEIRELERMFPAENKKPFSPQRTNARLDEIRRLELEAEDSSPTTQVEVADAPPVYSQPSTAGGNEDRAQDIEGLSKRIASMTRLDAISESEPKSNAEAPPRFSPHDASSPKDKSQQKSSYKSLDGERLRDNPVTTAFSSAPQNGDKEPQLHQQGGDDDNALQEQEAKVHTPAKEDSQDLLRRLARASSKSPSPSPLQDQKVLEPRREQEQKVEAVPISTDRFSTSAVKDSEVDGGPAAPVSLVNKALSPSKHTVGFAGISRSNSNNSVASKSSVVSWDPTPRIQAEAKLFALGNDSERGSLRAPSPIPNSDLDEEEEEEEMDKDADETPRPNRVDPLSMPTPVVTGAFLETPAPVKAEQGGRSPSRFLSPEKRGPKDRNLSTSPRGTRSEGHRRPTRQASSRDTRRTKSTSRPRSPLRNSVKPPTVGDDLREILRKNDLDDSTLDDVTDLVLSSSDPEKLVEILKPKSKGDMDELLQDEQLRRLSGMSEALKTGLAGIRTARKGIERLEGQISRPETHPSSATNGLAIPTKNDGFTYIQVPIPRLYRTKPKFRPTLLGFLFLLLSFWHIYWAVENVFYDTWGKQKVCYRGSPCRWDMDDPEYGFVIPVKVDEWITGGAIRPHAARWLEEAQDSWADFEDWLTGTDIRKVNHQAIRDSAKKDQYWRRIEKKGLFPKWNPDPWMRPQFEAWEHEAQAREAAEDRAVLGYNDPDEPTNDSESMEKDQPISRDSTTVDSSGSWW